MLFAIKRIAVQHSKGGRASFQRLGSYTTLQKRQASFSAFVISYKDVACDLPYEEGTEELKDKGNLLIFVESMRSLMQKTRPLWTTPFQALTNNNSSEDPVSMVVLGIMELFLRMSILKQIV